MRRVSLPGVMLNIHHLELFYYVARHGGITPALKHIPYGIQQPAVSLQLGRLEESIGVALFCRRPFSLTPAGREVFEFIAPFFGRLPQLADRLRGATSSQLRIAAAATALRDHLPGLLKAIELELPGLRISMKEAAQPDAERLLREHEADIAIVVRESAPGCASQTLIELAPALVVSRDAPWKSAAAIFKAAQAGGLPLVAQPVREKLSREFQQALTERKVDWLPQIEASSIELVETYVAEGFGVGLTLKVPGRAVRAEVRLVPLPGFPRQSVVALWSGKLSTPAARFLELAKVRARELV